MKIFVLLLILINISAYYAVGIVNVANGMTWYDMNYESNKLIYIMAFVTPNGIYLLKSNSGTGFKYSSVFSPSLIQSSIQLSIAAIVYDRFLYMCYPSADYDSASTSRGAIELRVETIDGSVHVLFDLHENNADREITRLAYPCTKITFEDIYTKYIRNALSIGILGAIVFKNAMGKTITIQQGSTSGPIVGIIENFVVNNVNYFLDPRMSSALSTTFTATAITSNVADGIKFRGDQNCNEVYVSLPIPSTISTYICTLSWLSNSIRIYNTTTHNTEESCLTKSINTMLQNNYTYSRLTISTANNILIDNDVIVF